MALDNVNMNIRNFSGGDSEMPTSGLSSMLGDLQQEGFTPNQEATGDDKAEVSSGAGTAGASGDAGTAAQSKVEDSNVEEEANSSDSIQPVVMEEAPFTLFHMDKVESFSNGWNPQMEEVQFLGQTEMRLSYMLSLEQMYRVNMPIRACGIDPILFEYLDYQEEGSGKIFTIGSGEYEKRSPKFELVEADGELYLSCVTECVDQSYLNKVIMEATEAISKYGHYTYEICGFRKLYNTDGGPGQMIYTLRMNSFEMSALCSYMAQNESIQTSFVEIDGKQAIEFTLS